MSHMGKASSDVRYDPNAGPEAYTNPMVGARLVAYTQMGKEKYGPDWDPATAPLDGEIIMRLGGGRVHGRYAIGDSTLDTASTPTLSQIRASSANPDIRRRTTASDHAMAKLQVISVLFFVSFISK